MQIRIAGLDPALRNLGMVKGTLDLQSGVFLPEELILVKTESTDQKVVRKNSDDLERARKIHIPMFTFLENVDLVCVEIPVGSQSARAMASYGISIGLLAAIDKPLIQVTPTQVKLAGAGTKQASKIDMITWAVTQYPQLNWKYVMRKGIKDLTADNEHLADAVAAVHAGLKTDDFKLITAMWRSNGNRL